MYHLEYGKSKAFDSKKKKKKVKSFCFNNATTIL